MSLTAKPKLLSMIALSVGTMLGSGWLFASYYAAKGAGGASIFSWITAAILVLAMALMLSEIAVKYPVNALFTRLLSLSHNRHFGFVTGLSNWLVGLIIVPSEAISSAQYISGLYKPWFRYFFSHGQLTLLGMTIVILFMLLYLAVNYWGIKLLSKINNPLVLMKFIIPIFTAIIIMAMAYDPENFTRYHDTLIPLGVASIFTTIVHSGIFYSFSGFQTAASFAAEVDNPKRNIPIALISSVVIVLGIYLILQIAFIGALPAHMVAQGWTQLNFSSPLAQLAGLIGLNFLAVILYADACISPSDTGLVFLGASSRMLNEMVKHEQMPKFMGNRSSNIQFSRRSLLITFAVSLILVLFFNNWQKIAALATTFILIASIALPITHTRFSRQKNILMVKFLPFPQLFSIIIFLCLSYLLFLAGIKNVLVALLLHLILFVAYSYNSQHRSFKHTLKHFQSSWAIFAYLCIMLCFQYIKSAMTTPHLFYFFSAFIIVMSGLFYFMVTQKSYS